MVKQRPLEVVPIDRGLRISRRGTVFRVIAKSKNTKEKTVLPIVISKDPQKFFALFPEDNVDFELEIDNTACPRRHVRFALELHKELVHFSVGRSEKALLQAPLKGRRFHFIKESNPLAEQCIGSFATEKKVSFQKAKIIMGRLTFKHIKYSEPAFTLKVRPLGSDEDDVIPLKVFKSETVETVKEKLEPKCGIEPENQRLILRDRQMADPYTLGDFGIRRGSELTLTTGLVGGASSTDSSVSDDGSECPFGDCSSWNMHSTDDDDKPEDLPPKVGEPGIVIPGGRLLQHFQDEEFLPDDEDRRMVRNFVIELRMFQPSSFCKEV